MMLFACIANSIIGNAQNKTVLRPQMKFGNVVAEDFTPTAYEVDSSCEALYLFDKGKTYFTGNSNGFFSLINERIARIRIMKKSGFDIATVEIPLYAPKSGNPEKLISLEAVSYNIVNGKVEASKLEKDKIYKEVSGNYLNTKFTFPNIKEGSIIEYRYKTESPYYSTIDPWYFQGSYPRVWSELEIDLPEIFDYRLSLDGYRPFELDTTIVSKNNYTVLIPGNSAFQSSSTVNVNARTVERTWGMHNVKVLKVEPYISSLQNYISKISFQLSSMKLPDQPVKNYMKSWQEESADLYKDESFGLALQDNNRFMEEDLKKLPTIDTIETVKSIYKYVQSNLNYIDKRSIWLSQPLKETWKLKKGNISDINMALVAAYKRKGFEAYPVILSTRDHIRAFDIDPIMNRFNYVICRVDYKGTRYFLDASDKHLGFNKLNSFCYNGPTRTINEQFPELIYLSPDSIVERKSIFVNINPINKDSLEVGVGINYGNFNSKYQREKILDAGKNKFLENIENSYSPNITMTESQIDSLNNFEMPLYVGFKYNINLGGEDIFYFNPIVFDRDKENPFKSDERSYPVEFTAKIQENYFFNMSIPNGYEVDEIPKSARVKLNETDGMFEYLVSKNESMIQLKCSIVLNRATFAPEDYNTLRDFYSYIVKKENEPIVFKKKK